MMRRHNDAPNDVYEEPGTLVVWRWLGLDRFFPPGVEYHQKILRGCASVRLVNYTALSEPPDR